MESREELRKKIERAENEAKKLREENAELKKASKVTKNRMMKTDEDQEVKKK